MRRPTPLLMWTTFFVTLVGLALPTPARAATISFAGTAQVCDTPPHCDGFGLPIDTGDSFTGWFRFDGDTPTDFRVSFPRVSFVATDLTLQTQPFDGHIQFANLQGRIAGGLFINIGLTGGEPRPDLLSPVVWDCRQWFLCGFQLNANGVLAVEEGWLETDAIAAVSSRGDPDQPFSLFTTPEPSTALLLGGAAVLLLLRAGRRHE